MQPTSEDSGQAPGGEPEGRDRAALEAENNQLRDHLLRVAADLDNYKKRVRKEREEGERHARADVLLDVLEVVDALERAGAALDGGADPRAVRDGVSLGLRALHNSFAHHGLTPLTTVGARFDPRVHEAVAHAPSTAVAPGTIVEETKKGYLLDGRLLRPSRVVVAAAATDNGSGAGQPPDQEHPTPVPE
jgi:molecular chaperone GrpE